jgi:hypothetical protein
MLILCYLIVAASFFVHVDPNSSKYLSSLFSLEARGLHIGSKFQGLLRSYKISQWDDFFFLQNCFIFALGEILQWLSDTYNFIYICSYKLMMWLQSCIFFYALVQILHSLTRYQGNL